MGLVLLVALFSKRGRCLHDMMTGVFAVNVSENKAQVMRERLRRAIH